MKYPILKKKLITEAMLLAGAVALCLGLAYGAEMVSGTAIERQKNLEQEINKIGSEIRTVRTNFQRAESSVDLYKKIVRSIEKKDFEINRDTVKNLLLDLRDRYRLSSLNLTMSPEETLTGSVYDLSDMHVITSEISVSFGGMSDQHIYAFIQALATQLSGYKQYLTFTLKRQKSLEHEILYQINQGSKPEMVGGDMSFRWIGLRQIEKQGEAGGE